MEIVSVHQSDQDTEVQSEGMQEELDWNIRLFLHPFFQLLIGLIKTIFFPVLFWNKGPEFYLNWCTNYKFIYQNIRTESFNVTHEYLYKSHTWKPTGLT
jgi:hypothetical protein